MMLDGSQQVAIMAYFRLHDRGHLHENTRLSLAQLTMRGEYIRRYRGNGTVVDLMLFFIGVLLRFDNHIRNELKKRLASTASNEAIINQRAP